MRTSKRLFLSFRSFSSFLSFFSSLPLWILLGILRLIILLPYKTQMKLGEFFGLMGYRFSKREKRIAEINLKTCFPNMSEAERTALLKKSFIAAAQGMLETAFGFWGNPKRLKKLAKMQHYEIFEEALKQNKGILFFGPHMSSVYFLARLLNLFHPAGGMYLPPKNAFLRARIEKALEYCLDFSVKRNDVRALVDALKQNKVALYTPDTDAGKNGLFVPFFNVPASTVTTVSRLATMTDCVVIPGLYARRADYTGIDMIFLEPLKNFPTGDEYQDTLVINQWLEKLILEHPEQYLWQYKRFKSRPKDEIPKKDFYASSTLVS